MAGVVYMLSAVTSLLCAILLLFHFKRTRVRLLLWNGICFASLSVNNFILYVDFEVVPQTDLSLIRLLPGFIGSVILLSGLIWDSVN